MMTAAEQQREKAIEQGFDRLFAARRPFFHPQRAVSTYTYSETEELIGIHYLRADTNNPELTLADLVRDGHIKPIRGAGEKAMFTRPEIVRFWSTFPVSDGRYAHTIPSDMVREIAGHPSVAMYGEDGDVLVPVALFRYLQREFDKEPLY
jgi:hypothetical protein